jgi:hypothetical protein
LNRRLDLVLVEPHGPAGNQQVIDGTDSVTDLATADELAESEAGTVQGVVS